MGAPEPIASESDLAAIIAKLKSGETSWAAVSADLRIQIEHTNNPETSRPYSEFDFSGGSAGGAPGLDLSKILSAGAASTTDPVLIDAAKIYYQLYGVAAPSGLLEGLEKDLGDIFAIKDALVAQAKQDKAPGLADFLSGGTGTTNPIVSAAESYYAQLYGKTAPKGMLEKMVAGGMDLYAIQSQLLESAGAAGAPGYDNIRYANLMSAGNSLYFKLWGEDAPPTSVKGLVDQGLNLFQMEQTWRADPTFKSTKTYKDEESQYAGVVANLLGER